MSAVELFQWNTWLHILHSSKRQAKVHSALGSPNSLLLKTSSGHKSSLHLRKSVSKTPPGYLTALYFEDTFKMLSDKSILHCLHEFSLPTEKIRTPICHQTINVLEQGSCRGIHEIKNMQFTAYFNRSFISHPTTSIALESSVILKHEQQQTFPQYPWK